MPSPLSDAIALHTAARRYCIDAHAKWCGEYEKIVARGGDREDDGYHYTPEARRTFPRYNVLAAILEAVERIPIETLGSAELTRERLIAASSAESAFTRPPQGNLELAVIQQEREAFARFVRDLPSTSLSTVLPLPYRRVLNATESEQIWGDLRRRWQVGDGYWYPLDDSPISGVVAWKAQAFRAALPVAELQAILTERGIHRFWELREYGAQYECDVAWFDPFYNGAEGYWSSAGLDWIVYASHEDTLTVGGWLVGDLTKRWSGWEEHVLAE